MTPGFSPSEPLKLTGGVYFASFFLHPLSTFRHSAGEPFLVLSVHMDVHWLQEQRMSTIKVGVREFRERIATFLESDTPVAVTRRGETLGIYVPTPRKRPNTAEISELKAAADRLATALADVDEEELVSEFKQLPRGKCSSR